MPITADITNAMVPTLARQYDLLVSSGRIGRDPAQEQVVARLDGLAQRLKASRAKGRPKGFGWVFGRRDPEPVIKGLYLWGSVGRGKTMLMDMFFASLPVALKRRAHFHAFMTDVHERIHAWRQEA
jgi:cell division protein ZapE